MAALEAGKPAPEIQLTSTNGNAFSLSTESKNTPVIAAFFKVSCPVCQYAFPFIERIHKAYAGKGASIVGVSQNDKSETEAFAQQYGVTFPILLDDPKKYAVSNAYGITNVPSVFHVSTSGTIDLSSVGWSKQEMEQLNQMAAKAAGVTAVPLFKPGENVPDFKAG